MARDDARERAAPSPGRDLLRETGLDELIALLRQPGDSGALLESWLDELEGQP